MFNPILASQEIKQSFIDYISTTFSFSNQKYQTSLRNALKGQGVIAKGPYLEISGSYESGRNIEELIEDGFASPLFKSLESVPEEKKEIKLLRPLYTHQEESIIKAKKGHNLAKDGVVDTKQQNYMVITRYSRI